MNCVFIETPDSEYSDYMIVQEVSKEEREAGQRGAIIGNAKILARKVKSGEGNAEDVPAPDANKDDLPF